MICYLMDGYVFTDMGMNGAGRSAEFQCTGLGERVKNVVCNMYGFVKFNVIITYILQIYYNIGNNYT